MALDKGMLEFWWGKCFVSYGKPTEYDKIGCGGMYIESIHLKSHVHGILLWLIEKVKRAKR